MALNLWSSWQSCYHLHHNPDLCGVEVARDVGVGDVLAVDQLAQQEAIGVREVPCLKHLHGPHGNGLVGYI